MRAGEYYYFEAETHLSLLKSLQYSIEIGHQNYSNKVASYLVLHTKYIIKTHPLLNSADRMITEFYPQASQEIIAILNTYGHTKSDLISIDNNLKSLLKKVSVNYIDNIVNCIASFIGCKHQLQIHQKDIDYNAKLIFSYFYLNDYSRADISRFVSKLLEKGVKRYGDKIYIEGVIPINLHTRLIQHNVTNAPYDDILFKEIEMYFKNRSTIQQIKGFVDLAKYEKHKHTFIFKIDGASIKENEININGMRLIKTEHFRKLYESSLKYDSVNNFLDASSVLIEYSTQAHSQTLAEDEALSEVKTKIDRIGFILDKHLNLNTLGYIVKTNNELLWVNDIAERVSISEWDIKAIQNRDTAVNNPEFRKFLLSKENILAEAHAEINIEKSIHGYSKFLEQLTKNNLNGIDSLGGIPPKVLAMVYILILSEHKSLKRTIRSWGYNAIINSIPHPRIGKENKVELQDFMGRKTLPSLSEMNKRFKHPHTRYRFKMVNDSRKNLSEIEAFHYYIRHLLMLVRYRNIQEHMSTGEKQYAKKLILSFNSLFARALNYISIELNKPQNIGLSAEEVVHNIVKEGKTKVDSLNISF